MLWKRVAELAPFGTWKSPLAPEVLAAASVRLGFPSFDAEGALYFTEQRAAEQGRVVVARVQPDGAIEDLLPAPFSARSRVHEYGGLSYLVVDDELHFVNEADQQLWCVSLKEEPCLPAPLTAIAGTRFAEPVLDPLRRRLIAVTEQHAAAGEVTNRLSAIDLATGAVTTLAEGRDFYAAASVSPDGSQLAFLAWDHPHMPWDAAELCVAKLARDGSLGEIERVAGGPAGAAFQPTWSPEGTLYFALEADEYWNLHRWEARRVERVVAMPADLAAPLWQLGTRLWAFSDARSVVGSCFEHGLSRLVRIDLERGTVEALEFDEDFAHVGQLAAHGGRLAFTLGWAGYGTRLISVEIGSRRGTSVRNASSGLLQAADTSLPEAVSFPTGTNELAHGFFYAPKNARFSAPEAALPPLIVIAHGGPTACTTPTFNPAVQFWTTRGFAVLDVNYRGSTGYGRSYRERLRGQWGVVDVEDCVAGARELAARGLVDARRLLIRGSSAGGYTVLQALANHDVFAAGSCHYGISDLEALTRETHKFESHYDRFLIGPYPERRDLFVERSPIHYVTRIRRPVVFFQGLDDKVVPAAQTETMAKTLRAHGIEADYHAYAGEQHGFRKPETLRHVLETELAFFLRVLEVEDSAP
jgi:dipeptidyl aminopeptidase/acylaminoacyl peptidase